jgi:NADH-quinone oxidoreductase subunit D
VRRTVASSPPKGELAFYVVSNWQTESVALSCAPASFVNLSALEKISIGAKIADFVVILAMFDIVMGECDR